MQKFFVIITFYFTLIFNLSSAHLSDILSNADSSIDITLNLHEYSQIDCELKERISNNKKTKRNTLVHAPINVGQSKNWCGYAAFTSINNPASNSVSAVVGTWLVPKLNPTIVDAYTAIWVGIDGFSSNTVEQIGTEHDWINGQQVNSAWFEMYPEASFNIVGFPVFVNDLIQGQVLFLGKTQFQLNLVNHTRKFYTTIPLARTRSTIAQRSSAEWIVEAPFSNGILPLSNFQQIAFVNCAATIKKITGPILSNTWEIDALAMVNNGVIKALPSPLTPDRKAFLVTWEHE